MLALRYLLITGGMGMILVAVGILLHDLYHEVLYRRALAAPAGEAVVPQRPEWRWRTSLALGLLAWGPILLAFAIVVGNPHAFANSSGLVAVSKQYRG